MIATSNMVLRVKLLGAVATTEADITGHYVVMRTSGIVDDVIAINTITAGTTPVIIASLSPTNSVNVLKNLQVANKDTAEITVILEQFNGARTRQIAAISLAVGESMGIDANSYIYVNRVPVVPVVPVVTIDTPLTAAAATSIASSATSVSLIAANTARRTLTIFNDSGKTLYICIGATATVNTAIYIVLPNEFYRMERPIYQGELSGIWAGGGAAGFANITEGT